jgi:hypothetical protein
MEMLVTLAVDHLSMMLAPELMLVELALKEMMEGF